MMDMTSTDERLPRYYVTYSKRGEYQVWLYAGLKGSSPTWEGLIDILKEEYKKVNHPLTLVPIRITDKRLLAGLEVLVNKMKRGAI